MSGRPEDRTDISDLGEHVSLGIKEWVVAEGIVSDALVDGTIKLPSEVAERLDLANRLLIGTTAILNSKLGSFGSPLAIRVLAGARTWQDNMAIAHSTAMFGYCRRNLRFGTRNPYDPSGANPNLNAGAECLANLDAHLDGRSVDVAIVELDTDRVFSTGNCYGSTFWDDRRPPRSFSGVVRPIGLQRVAALDLLCGAMKRAGFIRPDPHAYWHFEYSPDEKP